MLVMFTFYRIRLFGTNRQTAYSSIYSIHVEYKRIKYAEHFPTVFSVLL